MDSALLASREDCDGAASTASVTAASTVMDWLEFATFIVTSELHSELNGLAAANSAIAHHLAAEEQPGPDRWTVSQESLHRADKHWANRQVCAWLNQKVILNNSPSEGGAVPAPPQYVKAPFRDVVRDHDKLFLRVLETVPVAEGNLTVMSSEPFDQHLLQTLAASMVAGMACGRSSTAYCPARAIKSR